MATVTHFQVSKFEMGVGASKVEEPPITFDKEGKQLGRFVFFCALDAEQC